MDDSHFLNGRPTPGWVLLELCGPQCQMDVWDTFPPPALCASYGSNASCVPDRCRWGASEEWGFGPTAPGCYPRKLCTVGCELAAPVSLTWKYTTSMWYVFGSLDPKNLTLPER
eukprot:SAG22_NODE_221_length_14781_cov_82.531490_11_plen_114_part_00